MTHPNKKIVAIPAPAIYGQFNASPGQILSAIKQIGFDDVIEVAYGAEVTAANEAQELKERLAEGVTFMTSSCCPAYTGWVDKHAPMLKPYVSDTPKKSIRMRKLYLSVPVWPNVMKPNRSRKWIMS